MTFEPECSFFLLLKSYLTNQTDSTQWIIFPSYQRNLHNYEFPVLFNLMFSNEKDYLVWVHLIAFHRSLSQYRVNTGTIFPVEIRSPFIGVSFLSSSVWAPFSDQIFNLLLWFRAHTEEFIVIDITPKRGLWADFHCSSCQIEKVRTTKIR